MKIGCRRVRAVLSLLRQITLAEDCGREQGLTKTQSTAGNKNHAIADGTVVNP